MGNLPRRSRLCSHSANDSLLLTLVAFLITHSALCIQQPTRDLLQMRRLCFQEWCDVVRALLHLHCGRLAGDGGQLEHLASASLPAAVGSSSSSYMWARRIR